MAANGSKLPNFGQMMLSFQNSAGTAGRIMFQVANITKPLVSVSKLVDDGHQVVFDEKASYIIHKATGRKMLLKRERGVFVVDAYVEPRKSASKDFSRQG